jgi:mannitol/fructose-specific phosphotransferase system IIA component (Ntr-type)
VLTVERIIPEMASLHKDDALRELIETVRGESGLPSPEELFRLARMRELRGSTGLGEEIAAPHITLPGRVPLTAAIGVSREGIQYYAPDQHPVKFLFFLVGGELDPGGRLKALARGARVLRSQQFRDAALAVESANELYELIVDSESIFDGGS